MAIRDLQAELLLNVVIEGDEVETMLMSLNSGKILSRTTNTNKSARLDVSCRFLATSTEIIFQYLSQHGF